MLVLSRERDQSVIVGDNNTVHVPLSPSDRSALKRCADPALAGLARRLLDAEPGAIVVTVVDIRGDKVRSGYDAPKDVPVHRKEVYDAIRREQRAAAAACAGAGAIETAEGAVALKKPSVPVGWKGADRG